MRTYEDYSPAIKTTRIERVNGEQARTYESMFRAWAASVSLAVSDMNGTVSGRNGAEIETISAVVTIPNHYFARYSDMANAVDQIRIAWDDESRVFEWHGWNDEDADVACAMIVAYCNWHSAARNHRAGPKLLGVLRMDS